MNRLVRDAIRWTCRSATKMYESEYEVKFVGFESDAINKHGRASEVEMVMGCYPRGRGKK